MLHMPVQMQKLRFDLYLSFTQRQTSQLPGSRKVMCTNTLKHGSNVRYGRCFNKVQCGTVTATGNCPLPIFFAISRQVKQFLIISENLIFYQNTLIFAESILLKFQICHCPTKKMLSLQKRGCIELYYTTRTNFYSRKW